MAGESTSSATVSRCTCSGQSGTALNCAAGWEIYLTFDDGPGVGTFEVLDVLDAHGIPGTFLMTGTNFSKPQAEEASQRVREAFHALKLADEWHLLGNHSWTHDFSLYRTPEKMVEDFKVNESIVEYEYQNLGEAYLPAEFKRYGRLPYCNTWRVDLADAALRISLDYDEWASVKGNADVADQLADASLGNGYEMYGWDQDWHGYDDGKSDTQKAMEPLKAAADMVEEATARLERGVVSTGTFKNGVLPEGTQRARKLVVLGHDRIFANGGAQQLDEFVRQMKACGAVFKTLREY